MSKTVIRLAGAAIAVLALTQTGIADVTDTAKCGEREELAEILKDKFDQHPVGVGLSHQSTQAFEVFASNDGSWTVMMTQTNGKTCIMAGGHSWQDVPKPVPGVPT